MAASSHKLTAQATDINRGGELQAGKRLKALREQLGLTVRGVETFSARIAKKHGNPAYAIPTSRLSDIENKAVIPTIYRVYSLAVIYRREFQEILDWYGVNLGNIGSDLGLAEVPRSHRVENLDTATCITLPVQSPTSDIGLRQTLSLGSLIDQPKWPATLKFLGSFAKRQYSYGFVGTEDFTMFPILSPGALVLVDESKHKIIAKRWRSEYERPIYFVETREGYKCCWCSLKDDKITLQPHPLSPEPVRILQHPQEAEVIGTVVGVAMHLATGMAAEAAHILDVPKT